MDEVGDSNYSHILSGGKIHLTGAATNPWIRFEQDFDLESAVFNFNFKF